MAADFHIKDGEGVGTKAGVTLDHALKVTVVEPLSVAVPAEVMTRRKLLNAFLIDSADSNDLTIDGSTTPVEFSVSSLPDRVRWISSLRFILNGTNLELDTLDFRRFGAATVVNTPLATGLAFFVEQGGVVSNFIVDPIGTIGDLNIYADDFRNFVNAVSATEDYLAFDYNFVQPVVLPIGSQDRIVVTVQDDLTAIALFKVLVRGYQELA